MAIRITNDESGELTLENFETASLLRAVDAIDAMRNHLNDGENGTAAQQCQ